MVWRGITMFGFLEVTSNLICKKLDPKVHFEVQAVMVGVQT